MADFPSKVNTETSSPNPQSSQQGGNSLRGLAANVTIRMDLTFLRSIVAVLMMVESILGLLQWALIASTHYTWIPAYGWVMFVAVTFWLLTTILFFLILFGVQQKMTFVPLATDGDGVQRHSHAPLSDRLPDQCSFRQSLLLWASCSCRWLWFGGDLGVRYQCVLLLSGLEGRWRKRCCQHGADL
ncbi:unnamed protein product, partial [Lampetra planeri]